jgi:sulfur-oxidizing protein SoxZ
MQPRVQAPGTAAKGEIFQVRTLIDHEMETGLRHDSSGNKIPRRIVNKFTCRYNDVVVFSVDLHEAVAANPYLAFYVRAAESGRLHFTWEEDGGAVSTLEKPITVTG